MRERANCRGGCSFSFSIGYEKTIGEELRMVNRADKNVPQKQHVEIGNMKKINAEFILR